MLRSRVFSMTAAVLALALFTLPAMGDPTFGGSRDRIPPRPPGGGDGGTDPNDAESWGECMDGCQAVYDKTCAQGCDCGIASDCEAQAKFVANECELDCGVDHLP